MYQQLPVQCLSLCSDSPIFCKCYFATRHFYAWTTMWWCSYIFSCVIFIIQLGIAASVQQSWGKTSPRYFWIPSPPFCFLRTQPGVVQMFSRCSCRRAKLVQGLLQILSYFNPGTVFHVQTVLPALPTMRPGCRLFVQISRPVVIASGEPGAGDEERPTEAGPAGSRQKDCSRVCDCVVCLSLCVTASWLTGCGTNPCVRVRIFWFKWKEENRRVACDYSFFTSHVSIIILCRFVTVRYSLWIGLYWKNIYIYFHNDSQLHFNPYFHTSRKGKLAHLSLFQKLLNRIKLEHLLFYVLVLFGCEHTLIWIELPLNVQKKHFRHLNIGSSFLSILFSKWIFLYSSDTQP